MLQEIHGTNQQSNAAIHMKEEKNRSAGTIPKWAYAMKEAVPALEEWNSHDSKAHNLAVPLFSVCMYELWEFKGTEMVANVVWW